MTAFYGLPDRQTTRIANYDYSLPGHYGITICTAIHHQAFGAVVEQEMHLSPEGRVAEGVWRSLPERFPNVALDAYVFMPNHMHGIITIKRVPVNVESSTIPKRFHPHIKGLEEERLKNHPERYRAAPPVGEIVRTFKAAATRLIRTSGSPSFGWQKSYWLTIISTEEYLKTARAYVHANPSKWHEDPDHLHISE